MSFHVIAGTFHIRGYSPDGDSIRFAANRADAWDVLSGRRANPNARGHVQLRLEAIDTLETHYAGHHQPLQYAEKAAHELFAALGIHNVIWDADHYEVTSADDNVPGFILARTTGTYGRPVSFALSADAGKALGLTDGEPHFLTADELAATANAELLNEGLAYPTFYTGLFHDLRERFAEQTRAARNAERGLWPSDRTNTGVTVDDLASITKDAVILPKLFRRLVDYLGTGGSIAGFTDYLANNPDRVMVLPQAHFTHLDNLVAVDGHSIRLTEKPENLVFSE